MEKRTLQKERQIHVPKGVELTPPLKIYLEEVERIPVLDENEERLLGKEVQSGNPDARLKLEEASLRQVVAIAGEYVDCGMLFSDLIQEGNLGLMCAAKEFDSDEDGLFSVFAKQYIRDAIVCALSEQSGEIKLPAQVAKTMHTVKEAENKLRGELGHNPTVQELAQYLPDSSEDEINDMLAFLEQTAGETETNEDVEVFEKGPLTQEDVTENAMAMLIQKEEVRHLLESLDEQETDVISARFGLDGEKAKSYGELAERLSLTEAEIHKIEEKAMDKLREAAQDN